MKCPMRFDGREYRGAECLGPRCAWYATPIKGDESLRGCAVAMQAVFMPVDRASLSINAYVEGASDGQGA